MSQQTLIFNNQ